MSGKLSRTKPPKAWPQALPHLTQNMYSKHLTAEELASLRRPSAQSRSSTTCRPSEKIRIFKITDLAHPACGQYGLFATTNLSPSTSITPYYGLIHNVNCTDITSDYDLSLDRDVGISVDATNMGNEARFINDYRGVPGGNGTPNAEFRDIWVGCGNGMEEKTIGVFVLGEGRSGKRAGGIKKGEEILVSYGKGFWACRSQQYDSRSP